jgi:hypothetical protein
MTEDGKHFDTAIDRDAPSGKLGALAAEAFVAPRANKSRRR